MLVDNAPFYEAFRESGLSVKEVARRMDVHWATVGRALGMIHVRDKRRAPPGCVAAYYFNTRMRYETAVKMARALNVDPVDVGL